MSLLAGVPALFVLSVPATLVVGCGGGGGGGTGTGGTSGGGLDPANLLSDFEDPAAATIVQAGTPARNGYWFSYNDMSTSCVQMPANGAAYLGETPPMASPKGGGLALHGKWTGCATWGAGVGADLNQPMVDGGTYTGPKVAYDLTGYTGITFWLRSDPNADNKFRVKLNMTDETKIADGGSCDEAVVGMNKCSDAFGYVFSAPTNGNWAQITVKFSDNTTFKQEGWGQTFAWNPAHVTSVQIQSQGSETSQSYDFWIDDVYLTK